MKEAPLRLGFLGFGEAGFVISNALQRNGLAGAVAYDCNCHDPSLGGLIQRRAAEAAVELLPSNADLVAKTDVILSVVTASSAEEAAWETASHLRPGHIFCDCNSVSPYTKTRVAQVIGASGAGFVEAAIMAPVNADLQRVPFLMTGTSAPQLAHDLAAFGMKIEVMTAPTGSAAAVKMCRSIVIKGLEAILLECRATAAQFGCEDAVLGSLEASNPEFHWKKLSEYMIGRVLEHGVRRAAEMKEVAAMQHEAGLPAIMSLAAAEVQNWRARLPDAKIGTPAELISALAASHKI